MSNHWKSLERRALLKRARDHAQRAYAAVLVGKWSTADEEFGQLDNVIGRLWDSEEKSAESVQPET